MLKHYEQRKETLEKRQDELVRKIRFMECALPSMLIGYSLAKDKIKDPVVVPR